jgi:hypothetical protein
MALFARGLFIKAVFITMVFIRLFIRIGRLGSLRSMRCRPTYFSYVVVYITFNYTF